MRVGLRTNYCGPVTNEGGAVVERVGRALADRSLNWLSSETGIPYKTLWRRMNFAPELFTVQELAAIARVTGANWAVLFFGLPETAVA